jgi:dTMP kinase
MPKNKGKFIVVEGIDGCGGETQTKKMSDFLKAKGIDHVRLRHPNYKTPLGKLISRGLYGKDNFPKAIQMLLYFTEIFQERDEIMRMVNEGMVVIADRYFTSTLAYQGQDKKDLEKLLGIEKMFSLPKPDICILIDISPETSYARKQKEKKGNLDNFEKDLSFLKKSAKNYAKLAKDDVFCKWEVIDGEGSKDEVFEKIKIIINNKLRIK